VLQDLIKQRSEQQSCIEQRKTAAAVRGGKLILTRLAKWGGEALKNFLFYEKGSRRGIRKTTGFAAFIVLGALKKLVRPKKKLLRSRDHRQGKTREGKRRTKGKEGGVDSEWAVTCGSAS